ncbi:MAG: hypothetical protein KKD28_15195 [Chloroflexi bacterium]|nr:hypothetical protein [Chloroflexota bacterium]MBU1662805.1 hypothetical protein [Chloroflexota bacterium]
MGRRLRQWGRSKIKMIPVSVAEGKEIYLSSGSHSKLLKAIIEEFAPRFTCVSKGVLLANQEKVENASRSRYSQ